MDLITGGVIVAVLAAGAFTASAFFDYKKKTLTLAASNGKAKPKQSSFSDYIDGLPFALQQSINIYNEQLAICQKNGVAEDVALKSLKPLKDKIDLMQTLTKVPEPLLRLGANIADKGAKSLEKAVGDFGV